MQLVKQTSEGVHKAGCALTKVCTKREPLYIGSQNLIQNSERSKDKIFFFDVSIGEVANCIDNLPDNYPLFFSDTQLSPSLTLNILSLSLTHNLNWELHISSLANTASMKLGVLSRLRQFFSPPQLLTLYRGLSCPCMEYA